MTNPTAPHLTQDQLMQALLDKDQLPAPVQEHLAACTVCKEEQKKLSERFKQLTTLSRRVESQPKPWFSLGRGGADTTAPRPFGLKFLLILAMVITLILLLNRYNPFGIKPNENAVQLSLYTRPVDPLPEIYSGLLTLWWRDEIYISGLQLTPDEIRSLNAAWKETLTSEETLKKKISDGQVELAVGLESRTWVKDTVQRRYQQLSQDFTLLTDQRFELLQKIRTILGYQRFQALLTLQKR